jgi:protein involved in polysaccharide export with SLBB domain
MGKWLSWILFAVLSVQLTLAQSFDPFQGTTGQGSTTNCSDPAAAGNPECRPAQSQQAGGQAATDSSLTVHSPVLTAAPDQYIPAAPPVNPSQMPHSETPTRPQTEFQQIVADSVGRPLPLFGQALFSQAPSTFAPIDRMGVPADYVIGPGDELQINVWGQVQANLRVTVDRAGQIFIPQVGDISVAGIHYRDLEQHLKDQIAKVFKNFDLTATVGRLRTIQVIVLGSARYPGTYTISSLSTLVNAVFASGGPLPEGSLRHVQLRREGATISDFDFYDLLVKGDNSKDARLQPGDVIYYPPVGPLVAIAGSVNSPAIYEMKDTSMLDDLIATAGGFSTVANTGRITIDRIVDHHSRRLQHGREHRQDHN